MQHVCNDAHGWVVDMKRKTQVGDPGQYVSHYHELGASQTRSGSVAVNFFSAVPQRPVAGKRF